MKKALFANKLAALFLIAFTVFVFLSPEFAEARRGGSFGGSRGFGRSSRSAPRSSFFNSKSSSSKKSFSSPSRSRSSFGGTRMSSQQAKMKYGTPRKVQAQKIYKNGVATNYRFNNYGGYSSGLMTGYMMGHTSWMWSMPFHPAFYYSRPVVVNNPDGTVDVYPPSFSFMKLIIGLIFLLVIFLIIRSFIRKLKGNSSGGISNKSSFS